MNKLSIPSIIRSEYLVKTNKVTFKETSIYREIFDLLKSLNTSYNFLAKNEEALSVLIEYLYTQSDINFSILLEDYIVSQGLKTDILKYLIQNKAFINTHYIDYYRLINLYISANTKVTDLSQAVCEIKDLETLYELDKAILFDLKNLKNFFKIQLVFLKNIPDIDIKEFDYNKININDILEIFILKKFNIDNITDLDEFVERTEDIFNVLDISKTDYLYMLFLFFFKYQKEKIFIEL